MVFRLNPAMVGEEGSRRRNNIIVLAAILGVLVCGYYLFSQSRENSLLREKNKLTNLSLKKYASAFLKCDRSLQTSKSDVTNFQEATKQLHAKVAKQEKDLAEAERVSADHEAKLEQAYQFFLDVKDLLKNDQSISEERQLSEPTALALKQEIQKLQSEQSDYARLKQTHQKTTEGLHKLKAVHDDLVTRSTQLEEHARKLFDNTKGLKRDVRIKNQQLENKSLVVVSLQNTVERLQGEIAKLTAKLAAAVKPKPTVVKTVGLPAAVATEKVTANVDSEVVKATVGNVAKRVASIVEAAPQEEVKSEKKSDGKSEVKADVKSKKTLGEESKESFEPVSAVEFEAKTPSTDKKVATERRIVEHKATPAENALPSSKDPAVTAAPDADTPASEDSNAAAQTVAGEEVDNDAEEATAEEGVDGEDESDDAAK